MTPMTGTGKLRERLTIQENLPDVLSVTTLTRVTTTATATTAAPHGYVSGDFATIAGATVAGFNGNKQVTVTGPTTFTYQVLSSLVTPAAGTITATYFSSAGGGHVIGWATLADIWAELLPVRAMERIQAQALQAELDYRFRIHTRGDLTHEMRALWTPQWPPGSPLHTLEIHGITPDGDGRQYLLLECGEIAA
jgi:head-tail adaptor